MADSSLQTLLDIASRRFGAERSALSAEQDLFETLGIDSMKALELLSDVEMEFDIEIPDYEVQDVRTFADLASVIDARL